MVKKLYETEYDDNLHMGDAKDIPGGKRGMLYNENGLKEHAVFREVSEEELIARYRKQHKDDYRRPLTPEEIEFYDHLAEIGAFLLIRGIEVATPHVKRVFQEQIFPQGKKFISAIRKKFSSVNPDKSKKNSSAKNSTSTDKLTVLDSDTSISNKTHLKYERSEKTSSETERHLPEMESKLISEDEAKERLARIMLLTQTIADECKDLEHCRVIKTNSSFSELTGLVGTDTFTSYVHAVLDGEGRFLPESSTREFLRFLYSEDASKAITALPLEEDNNRDKNAQ